MVTMDFTSQVFIPKGSRESGRKIVVWLCYILGVMNRVQRKNKNYKKDMLVRTGY